MCNVDVRDYFGIIFHGYNTTSQIDFYYNYYFINTDIRSIFVIRKDFLLISNIKFRLYMPKDWGGIKENL